MVVTDDLNIPIGTFRLKSKANDVGHKVLKDTQLFLNTTKYNRFRFGISDTFSTGRQVDYVLSEWSNEEQKILSERLLKAVDAIKSFGLAGISITMNTFNGK